MSQDGGRERINQKARTRTDLLASAAALIRAGRRPTVEEVASAAGISKRTAYRYFTSQEHLLADAALETLRPRMDALLNAMPASQDVHVRVANLAVALRRLADEYDAELREMIRASLTRTARPATGRAPPQRGNRRLDWIRTALEPVRGTLEPEQFDALTHCLAVCLGIDALMVLRDICGVEGKQAEQIMVFMAGVIIDRMLADQVKTLRRL